MLTWSVLAYRWIGRIKERIDRTVDAISPGWGLRRRLKMVDDLLKWMTSNDPSQWFTRPIAYNANGLTLYLSHRDTVVTRRIILDGTWERAESILFGQVIRRGDAVLDLGAHVGHYTLLAASRTGEEGAVFAAEPDPENFSLLQQNVKVNHLEGIVIAQQIAASQQYEEKHLFLNDQNRGDNRLYDSGDRRGSVIVRCVPFGPYLAEQYPRVSDRLRVIKMDLQGYETFAFKGLMPLLERDGLHLFTEFNPHFLELSGSSWQEFLGLISQSGFRVFIIKKTDRDLSDLKPFTFKDAELLAQHTRGEVDLYCVKHPPF